MPFFHPSKTGGFFYQQEDSPENSNFVDWPSEMSFPGNGVARMDPSGATDFGIGKNISGFNDSIGGCNMDFAATKSRGYAYKADDPRDIEYKAIISFEDIDLDQGFSISFDTGHHASDEPCCQGFAYMVNCRPGADPCEFRFRKEMWHVHYSSTPFFTDDRVNFKLNGHGYIGFGGVRYNKPNTTDTVIMEIWFNNDPINHPLDWFLVDTFEDGPNTNFGDGGDQCNGDDAQVGTWSNVQSRMKTNSSGGTCLFKAITLREIDVTKSFDDTPPPIDTNCPSGQVWNGTACVPIDGGGGTPPGGGGTGIPSQISPVISYVLVNASTAGFPTFHPPMTGLQSMMLALAEDLAETMTNPNPAQIDGPEGWRGPAGTGTNAEGEIGDLPCDHNFSADTNLPQVYTFADGIMVEPYWSNKDNGCSLGLSGAPPGGGNPPPTVVEANISQVIIGDIQDFISGSGISNRADFIVMVIAEEVIECQTDTEDDGWSANVSDSDPETGGDGQIGERCDGPGQNGVFLDTYADGIVVEGYWSNALGGCTIPGLMEDPGERNSGTPAGNLVYHGGRVMTHPVVNLIFWGNDWTGQSNPSMSQVITRVRDKFLNPASSSGANFWDALNQYSGCGIPTYGDDIQYTDSDPPSGLDSDTDFEKYDVMLSDVMGILFPTDHGQSTMENQIFITLLPNGSILGDPNGSFFDGYHFWNTWAFTVNANNTTTIDTVPAPDSTIDSDGIAWLEATGEILSWEVSRADANDFRWSNDTEDAGLGYETAYFVKAADISSGGHTAMKLGGPNHSGDCGGGYKENGSCCCWYDLGIRQNGDIQVQIERPHPDNTDMDCDDCTMTNIGMGMQGHWIGIKHILYPEIAGGNVGHGGVRIKMYVSTDAIVNGVPTNDWKLVFNTLDTGQWLPEGDGYEWPMYQELEMRLSDVQRMSDLEMYKDKVFARRWIRGSGGGNPPPQCPPGQVWNGTACVSTGTGRIQYHGGRIMKTPIVNLIFWGQAWDDRVVTPTKAELVTAVGTKLFVTDKAYFNNLLQYSGIQVPIFGQAVTNLTYPVPTATLISEQDARLVINNTIETALLPQHPDYNNVIYVVFMPIGHTLYHPENNVQPTATHNSYKPTLTVSGSGSVDQPTDIIVIQGAFTLKSDINVYTTTTCSGTDLPPPPPDEPPVDPPAGGTSIFYKVSNTSNEKEISNESSSDNRTQITEKINSSSSAMVGKLLVQADCLLRKESGTNDVTPLIYFKIWDSGNNVVYTSPTTFTPDSLTTSFVGKTFDCSTNTHAFVVGDRCGIEWTGTDPDEFIWTAYATSDSGNTGSSGSYSVYKEGSSYDNQTGRRCSFTLWE